MISGSRFLQDHNFNLAKNNIFYDHKGKSIVISGSRFVQDHNFNLAKNNIFYDDNDKKCYFSPDENYGAGQI